MNFIVRLISVAVPVPFLDLLTYSVPSHLTMPAVGARVRVPVGTRAVYDVSPDGQKFLMNVWDAGASLPITVMINWTAKLGR